MRIEELTLYTRQLEAQRHFYTEVLEFEPLAAKEDEIAYQIGATTLRFVRRQEATPYHFAVNIPVNKEREALSWLRERVDILKDGDREIQDFSAWNAKAIYFYDADRNIVEFIARKNLKNAQAEPFSSQSLLEISEIGLASANLPEKVRFLTEKIGLDIYSGDLERFCAVGSETGLFICIDRNLKDWFPTGDKAYASAFVAKVAVNGRKYKLVFEDERTTIF
jgi:catechol-2,3-dioxygenase